MCIVEIHEIDIISINNTTTKESKQAKTKTLVSAVALKRGTTEQVLKSSTKSSFKILLNFSYEEEVSDF